MGGHLEDAQGGNRSKDGETKLISKILLKNFPYNRKYC